MSMTIFQDQNNNQSPQLSQKVSAEMKELSQLLSHGLELVADFIDHNDHQQSAGVK